MIAMIDKTTMNSLLSPSKTTTTTKINTMTMINNNINDMMNNMSDLEAWLSKLSQGTPL